MIINDFKKYTKKLNDSGLKATKQRVAICKALFNRERTFHFTITELKKILNNEYTKEIISMATLYNTVHALKNNGYLKEIYIKKNITIFDTNTENHYHFYDEDTGKLTDINNKNTLVNNIPKVLPGKKIKEVDIIIRLANNNQKKKIKLKN